MPPEEFEKTRRGDCDDFALWAWRQLLGLGYDARFVVGRAGRYSAGHAWVSYRVHHHIFIMEPLLARYRKLARLETLRYRPSISVEVIGSQTKFFEHQMRLEPPFRIVAPHVFEWRFQDPRAIAFTPCAITFTFVAILYIEANISSAKALMIPARAPRAFTPCATPLSPSLSMTSHFALPPPMNPPRYLASVRVRPTHRGPRTT